MTLLIKNIKSLVGVFDGLGKKKFLSGTEMSSLNSIDNAFLLIANNQISDFGEMSVELISRLTSHITDLQTIDANGKLVLPSYCDSHTHLVFASSREQEFVDRIKGLSYQEIAQRGVR